MELKSLIVDSKTTWVEFPGLDGFEVELANLSRKELVNLRKRCVQNKFNRKTRAFEESLDENKIFEGDSICFGNERLAIIFAPDI